MQCESCKRDSVHASLETNPAQCERALHHERYARRCIPETVYHGARHITPLTFDHYVETFLAVLFFDYYSIA